MRGIVQGVIIPQLCVKYKEGFHQPAARGPEQAGHPLDIRREVRNSLGLKRHPVKGHPIVSRFYLECRRFR